MAQFNPLEIVKKLPRTNCGKCGYPSCLAFAMALMAGKVSPEKCPEARIELDFPKRPLEEDYHWRILEEIKREAAKLSWEELPERTGGRLTSEGLSLFYLDGEVLISEERAFRSDGVELDPRDQILLYNYLIRAQPDSLSGDFVGMESFPHSVSKVQTLRRYAEEKAIEAFSERLSPLKRALSFFRTQFPAECPAEVCAIIWILPKMPLRFHFFEAEPEEGLPAEAKILFDRKALSFLDLESLVFCAERLVERMIELSAEEN